MDSSKITMDALQVAPSMFRRRLHGDTKFFKNADGTDISVETQAVRYIIVKHLQAQESEGAAWYWLLRCGIKNITGLKDEDGQPIKFKQQRGDLGGYKFVAVADEILEGLDELMQEEIAGSVQELTQRTILERQRLGFTELSGETAPDGVPEDSLTPTENPSPVSSAEQTDNLEDTGL